MSGNCSHDRCEPYQRCQALPEQERRREWWLRQRRGIPDKDLVTDPVAWLEGDTTDG